MQTLITGGLGYIGSHIAAKISKNAVIIDNSINSKLNFKKILPECIVYNKTINEKNLDKIFKKHKINQVIHLASLKAVADSVVNPLKYYENNIMSSISLLKSMKKNNVNKLVFSSSATVYGNENKSPLKESMNLNAVNPYGSTKIIIEKLIDEYSNTNKKFKAISLRYFNPLGSSRIYNLPEQPIGKPQNIMPILLDSIKKKKIFKIFGDDYLTKDGTCIRDYIHVEDLAEAHLLSLRKINLITGHEKFNVGTGKGYSVLDLIKTFEKANHVKINYIFHKRRPGDADISYANINKIKKIIGWRPNFNLLDMCKDSFNNI